MAPPVFHPLHRLHRLHSLHPLHRRALCMACLCLLALAATGVMGLGLGEFHIAPRHVLNALWQDAAQGELSDAAFIVRELRLPRLLTGLLVGAALGLAGALVQALTRNPLGEPGLLGVTAGAAFATALCMAWFSLPVWAELALGTVGGIAAAALTLTIAAGARLEPLYLTLTGMSVNLFFAAAGPVTFVGLMAPHIVRFGLAAQGVSHRLLLPLSALVGAALVGCADLFAKWQEIPVGILCVLLGGPVLVCLIRDRK